MGSTTAVLLLAAAAAATLPQEGVAQTILGPARFTVISDSLIRLELGTPSSTGSAASSESAPNTAETVAWDDRPTLSYPGGRPVSEAPHTVDHPSSDIVVITTSHVLLRYDRSAAPGGAFTNASLSITLRGDNATVWRPGMQDPGNLRGSRLDIGCYATFETCYSNGLSPGPLSKSGWSLMDDTPGVRMETEDNPEVGFPWWSDAHPCDHETGVCGPTRTDWYFFAHGHRYRDALKDFAQVSGKASLPPKVAFGVWWSTWYNFTSFELTHTVLDGYARHGLPLDVVVMDMEWHTVDAPSFHPSMTNCTGWGGFTWNTKLIPDPSGFQAFLHSPDNPLGHPLATSLNGHSQSGIGPCQANYSAFARMIGKDPAEQANLHCDMGNATWTKALFETMLDPKGIDYWWTDYNGCASPTPGQFPLPQTSGCPVAKQQTSSTSELLWSNMVYDSMISKTGRRPLVLSRYGGIGNQRYGIGFSGDTESAWPTLRYQVEMTSTAANVLQAYWSHDIGGYNVYCPADADTITPCPCGHVVVPCNLTLGTCKRADGELYTRWLQFGAVSPIMRTHCSHCDRRIWVYPETQFSAMKSAMIFRNALGPYLYTAGRHAYDNAVAPVHPLYYDWPELPQAYAGTDDPAHTNPGESNTTGGFATDQYMLGESIMVAPITARSTPESPIDDCTVGKHWGCCDAHWSNHGLFATNVGNFDDLTHRSCANKCAKLKFTIMGVGWGGKGHGSQCLCGNTPPPPTRVLHNDQECTTQPCSGNKTQNCGGNWRTQVYSVVCKSQPPPPPAKKTVWLPPGAWVPWNTSSTSSRIIHGAETGVVIKDQPYALHEIPIFSKAGAVVPTQTMAKQAGPLVWIVFPFAGTNGSSFSCVGNGSNYDDDGNTTRYIQNVGTSWAHLNYEHSSGTVSDGSILTSMMSINISGSHGYNGNTVQLRKVRGSPAVQQVTFDGEILPHIEPPALEAPNAPTFSAGARPASTVPMAGTTKAGWWIVPDEHDSLWQAAGSAMISLPQQHHDNQGSSATTAASVLVSFRGDVSVEA